MVLSNLFYRVQIVKYSKPSKPSQIRKITIFTSI